jgi:sugar/nucleoside kinase (ribokinase family)
MSGPGRDGYSVFVGDVSLDEYFRTDVWPGSGAKVDMTPIGSHVGGMIANAAAVYAGYGRSVRFLWAMNDGEMSRLLLADLESLGIDTSLVIRDAALADSRNIIVLAQGEHTVLTPALGLETIALTDAALDALRGARYVYTAIGDLRSLRHDGRPATSVVADFRGAGAQLVLDLDVGHVRPGDEALIASADVLLVNRLGFERLRGGRTESETLANLLDGAARVVVVTLGPQGCRVASRSGAFTVPGIAVDPVDVTGAGDTFGASFVHALDVTDDLVAAATFANAAAARAVGSPGGRSGVATEQEVVAFADRHGVSVALHLQPTQDAGRAPRRHDDQVNTIERSAS